jgi:hypothetical protein
VAQGFNHAQVQFLWRAGIGAGGVADHQIVDVQQPDRILDLVKSGHAGREDDRATGGSQLSK